MIDFGFDKLALIGAVALIVIGPERLPKLARTVGHLMGKAQRYVADVKAEVNRSIEIDELKKMKEDYTDAARDVQQAFTKEVEQASAALGSHGDADHWTSSTNYDPPPPAYKHPGKNFRLKRGATPQWYKHRQGVRTHVQSGAARVARFRPPRSNS